MKIEVRKIEFGPERMHQETLCFTCDVYVNGRKVGYGENQGHGGMTFISAYPDQRKVIDDIEAYLKSMPRDEYEKLYGSGEYGQSLEHLVDDVTEKLYNQKQIDKAFKTILRKTAKAIVFGNADRLKSGEDVNYSLISYKFDLNQVLNVEKNPKAIEAIKAALKREIPKLKEGESVINENIKHLVDEVQAELANAS